MGRVLVLLCLLAGPLSAQPKRILYLTLSAGFKHDSIPTSIEVMRGLDPSRLQVIATEDTSLINAESLRTFDAVFFFTTGELPLSDAQKGALLDFVRSGKGFGGVHSATDTLYTWPEYAGLIGGTFDGHPWAQRVRIDVEDPTSPIVASLGVGFELDDEIYQFRNFSRDRVRVLMSLDTSSVDVSAPGVNRTDNDFALAWVQPYGQGRVFYAAPGHVDSTWRDARFQDLLRNGLLWITRQIDAPADPRPPVAPRVASDTAGPAIANAAGLTPRALSPGAIFTIFGDHLTPGSSAGTPSPAAPRKLAGATVLVNGNAVPLIYASPGQINAIAPLALAGDSAGVEIRAAGLTSDSIRVSVQERTPGVFATTVDGGTATIWATGFGIPPHTPSVEINGQPATITFFGLAPGWTGLYQINVLLPTGVTPPLQVTLRD